MYRLSYRNTTDGWGYDYVRQTGNYCRGIMFLYRCLFDRDISFYYRKLKLEVYVY